MKLGEWKGRMLTIESKEFQLDPIHIQHSDISIWDGKATLNIQCEPRDIFKEADEEMKKQVLERSVSILGDYKTPEWLDSVWKPSWPLTLKLDSCTFFNKHMTPTNIQPSSLGGKKVIFLVQPMGVWLVNEKVGISWKAHQGMIIQDAVPLFR